MNIVLNSTKTITTADGATFTARKDALKHGIKLAQRARLEALSFNVSVSQESEIGNWGYVQTDDLVAFVADNADAILEALTIKQTRKARTPKVMHTLTAGTQA